MSRRRHIQIPRTELNITSMMDLVLNLLTFFVLCSNFAIAEMPSLQLPEPHQSKAKSTENSNRVTVNILPDPAHPELALAIQVGSQHQLSRDSHAQLIALLQTEIEKSPTVAVDLRADRSLRFDQVSDVMTTIQAAGIKRINIVALVDNDNAHGN